MTVGVLAAFLLYLRMFFEPMQDISQFYNTFQSASAALEKLSGVLEEQPTVAEPGHPVPLPAARGDVRFDRVDFGYREGVGAARPRAATSRPGRRSPWSAPTGAGKTTIAKLMARFYDPTDGQRDPRRGRPARPERRRPAARGGDGDAGELHVHRHRRRQHRASASPSATREEVEARRPAVGAHDFIAALPEGYDTDVAKRGGRLSAGQRQLVAFARAFLADPAVLILDEATSSLDVPSERLVQRALRPSWPTGPRVIIAHRLTTVEIADRVLVLEHGRIIEDGSPADLMATADGRYAGLHQAWESSLA